MFKIYFSLNFYLLILLFSFVKISLNKKHSLILAYKIYNPFINAQSSKNETIQLLQRQYFYSVFEIGNPSKKIPLFYTFNNSELSFYSDSKFLSMLESSYNPSKSDSFKNLGNNVVQEVLSLNIKNKITMKNFTFLNTNDVNNYIYAGLQNFYKENKEKNVINPNFLYKLKSLGVINYISFNINQTSEDEGFININLEPSEYAPQLYSNEKKYTSPIRILESEIINSRSGEFLWSIELGFAYYKFEHKLITINIDHYELKENRYSALLNPTYGFIRCPRSFIYFMRRDFFQSFIMNNTCSFTTLNNLNFFTCNADNRELLKEKFLPLYFYYPAENYSFTYTFELNFDDLFYEKDGILYYLVIFDSTPFGEDKFSHISEWVLGKPFLDKYQFSFDVEKKEVSFYENKNGYKNRTIIKKYPNPNKNINNSNNNKMKDKKINNLYLSELLPTKNLCLIYLALFITFSGFLCFSYKLRRRHKKFFEETKKEFELNENFA